MVGALCGWGEQVCLHLYHQADEQDIALRQLVTFFRLKGMNLLSNGDSSSVVGCGITIPVVVYCRERSLSAQRTFSSRRPTAALDGAESDTAPAVIRLSRLLLLSTSRNHTPPPVVLRHQRRALTV
jgi:hypothetical protein